MKPFCFSFLKKTIVKRTAALLLVGVMGGALAGCDAGSGVSSDVSSDLSVSSGASSLAESSLAQSSSQAPESSAPSSSEASSQSSSSKVSSGDEVVQTGAGTGLGYKGTDWRLRIANLEMPVDESDIPQLVPLTCARDSKEHKFDARAVDSLYAMMDAAAAEGLNLYVISSYRTYTYQENLFERRVKNAMAQGYSRPVAENIAAEGTARPGTSDHNLGLAIDFNTIETDFEYTKEYKWLVEHCAEYGFIQRYMKDKVDITKVMYEPWHYRYVGVEHAKEIMARHLSLEEYVSQL